MRFWKNLAKEYLRKKKSVVKIYDPSFEPLGRSIANQCEDYLSVCAIIKNEAPYLKEWIEFHKLVGVTRFYLYDNGGDDETLNVLQPYIQEGIVYLIPWPTFTTYSNQQYLAYAHCARLSAGKTFWLIVIDLDEFLFAPKEKSLDVVLKRLEDHPAVGVFLHNFSSSNHIHKPNGLVIENYLMRPALRKKKKIKTIVQPGAITAISSAHWFHLDPSIKVDPGVSGAKRKNANRSFCVPLELLCINHYVTKSKEEFEAKLLRGDSTNRLNWQEKSIRNFNTLNKQATFEDDTILQFLPDLKKRLAE